MAEKWIKETGISESGHKGRLTRYCKSHGFGGVTAECKAYGKKHDGKFEGASVRHMIALSNTLKRFK